MSVRGGPQIWIAKPARNSTASRVVASKKNTQHRNPSAAPVDDYADKVIVTTIQKLGFALDGANKRNYKERLEPLRNQRMVFIFDECHRSQFGDKPQSDQGVLSQRPPMYSIRKVWSSKSGLERSDRKSSSTREGRMKKSSHPFGLRRRMTACPAFR